MHINKRIDTLVSCALCGHLNLIRVLDKFCKCECGAYVFATLNLDSEAFMKVIMDCYSIILDINMLKKHTSPFSIHECHEIILHDIFNAKYHEDLFEGVIAVIFIKIEIIDINISPFIVVRSLYSKN